MLRYRSVLIQTRIYRNYSGLSVFWMVHRLNLTV